MPPAPRPRIATGNALIEGDVVYLTYDGDWSRELSDAAVALTPEAGEALLAAAAEAPEEAVGVYLADCALDGQGRAAPVHFREAFRSRGPSNYPWLGKQAAKATESDLV